MSLHVQSFLRKFATTASSGQPGTPTVAAGVGGSSSPAGSVGGAGPLRPSSALTARASILSSRARPSIAAAPRSSGQSSAADAENRAPSALQVADQDASAAALKPTKTTPGGASFAWNIRVHWLGRITGGYLSFFSDRSCTALVLSLALTWYGMVFCRSIPPHHTPAWWPTLSPWPNVSSYSV